MLLRPNGSGNVGRSPPVVGDQVDPGPNRRALESCRVALEAFALAVLEVAARGEQAVGLPRHRVAIELAQFVVGQGLRDAVGVEVIDRRVHHEVIVVFDRSEREAVPALGTGRAVLHVTPNGLGVRRRSEIGRFERDVGDVDEVARRTLGRRREPATERIVSGDERVECSSHRGAVQRAFDLERHQAQPGESERRSPVAVGGFEIRLLDVRGRCRVNGRSRGSSS